LREWLRRQTGRPAPASLVERLGEELSGNGEASWPMHGATLHRRRGRLVCALASAATDCKVTEREKLLQLRRAGTYRLPGWGGALRVTRVKDGGVPLAWLAQLELRERSGGEQFQSGLGRPPRSLKKQFQAANLAAWERGGPLVFSGGQLVFVPGLGLDTRVIGLPGQAQVTLSWEPLPPV
jgi:tRNA(Ile)-lysidine synthase